MDAGDLVHSHPVDISDEETGGQLYTRLKLQAALSCSDFIEKASSHNLEYQPQNEEGVSFAPTLKKEDGYLDFKNSTSSKIYNQVRALKPWPGTYCYLQDQVMKVLEVKICEESINPSEAQVRGKSLFIGTKDSSIEIIKLQLPGKKAVMAQDFLNGHKGEIIINP